MTKRKNDSEIEAECINKMTKAEHQDEEMEAKVSRK